MIENLTSVNKVCAYYDYWKVLKDILVFHCYSIKMMTPKSPSTVEHPVGLLFIYFRFYIF